MNNTFVVYLYEKMIAEMLFDTIHSPSTYEILEYISKKNNKKPCMSILLRK